MKTETVKISSITYYSFAAVFFLGAIFLLGAVLTYTLPSQISGISIALGFAAGWCFGEPSREKTYRHRGDPSIQNLASTESVKELYEQAQNLQDSLNTMETIINTISQHSKLMNSERKYLEKCKSSFDTILSKVQTELNSNNLLNYSQKARLTTKISESLTTVSKEIKSSTEAIKSLTDQLAERSKKFDSQYNEINDSLEEIKFLLPQHEAFELAQDYHSARRRVYLGWTYFGFFLVLALYIGAVIVGLHFGSDPTNSDNSTWANDVFGSVAFRISIHFPFAAAAFILGRQILRGSRSREEYRHKEGVMKTYMGFSKELRKTPDTKRGKDERRLVNLVIDTIARPPAGTFIVPRKKRISFEDHTPLGNFENSTNSHENDDSLEEQTDNNEDQ